MYGEIVKICPEQITNTIMLTNRNFHRNIKTHQRANKTFMNKKKGKASPKYEKNIMELGETLSEKADKRKTNKKTLLTIKIVELNIFPIFLSFIISFITCVK